MESSKLSDREAQVCQRVREAREIASVTQAGLAKLVGIPRDRLSTYEKGRAPIRCDLGLRICRELIINEEWLASGETPTLNRLIKRTYPGSVGLTKMRQIFVRQAVDLQSEPVARSIPPGTLFTDAFFNALRPTYVRLAEQDLRFPRLNFTDDVPEPDLAKRLIDMIFDRQLILLRQLAEDVIKVPAWPAQRQFARTMLRLSMKAYGEFAKQGLDGAGLQAFVAAAEALEVNEVPPTNNPAVEIAAK